MTRTLRDYARHTYQCDAFNNPYCPCNCGLDALLAQTPDAIADQCASAERELNEAWKEIDRLKAELLKVSDQLHDEIDARIDADVRVEELEAQTPDTDHWPNCSRWRCSCAKPKPFRAE